MPLSTFRARGPARPRRAATPLAAALLLVLAAAPARAQFAGVPAPPPRKAAPPAPVAAARPAIDSVSRLQRERDSLALVQRLDIQAWVDSAAPALARRAPAAADSIRRPTPAPAPRRPERTTASVADRRHPLYLRPWPCPATRDLPPSRSA